MSQIDRLMELNHKIELSKDEIAEYNHLVSIVSVDIDSLFDEDELSEIQNETDQLNQIDPQCPAFYILAQIDSIIDKIQKGKISEKDHKKLIHYFKRVSIRVESVEWNSVVKRKPGRPIVNYDKEL